MKHLFLPFLALLAGCASEPSDAGIEPAKGEVKEAGKFPHGLWTEILKKFSKDGFVNYKGLMADRGEFDEYIGFLAKYSPDANPDLFPKPEDKMAYLVNAYNAYTMKGVMDRYPLKSVKIGFTGNDFWTTTTYPLGPKDKVTLEQLEKKIRDLGDPRIHFAINCASLGCPRLPDEAFEPARMEEQLSRETKKFVGEDRNVKVDGNTVHISSIFKWYKDEFPKDILEYIRKAGRDVPAGAKVDYLDYDWGINEQK